MVIFSLFFSFFFFNDTATTEIYTLSLHDALPISLQLADHRGVVVILEVEPQQPVTPIVQHLEVLDVVVVAEQPRDLDLQDRKSTHLNSSHSQISYAVFCLKKKKNKCTNRELQRHVL